ncbi:MAG: phage tail tape measure protein [Nitrospirae bacterium]|nr:phage tail tape measure protein [Nitrospirota bacterium]
MADLNLKIVIEAVTSGLDKLQQGFKAITNSLTEVRDKVKVTDDDFENAFQKLNMPDFKAVKEDMKSLESAYATLKSSGKLSMDELYKAKLQLQTKTDELKRSLNDYPSILSNMKAEFVGLAGAVYTASQTFSTYSAYSHKMNEVNTLVDTSKIKFSELSDVIVEISTRIPQSAQELAQGLYYLLSAGATIENAPKALEAASKAAVAGVSDTQTAIRAGMGIVNAYGIDINNLSRVYDTLFQSVRIGVTTFPELASYIGEVLPTARAAGIGLDEVSAAIVQLTKVGIRTPQAVTSLTQAIKAFAMPSDDMKKKLAELGIKWDGLLNTLKRVKELGLSPAELRGIVPDEEAVKAVLSLTQNYNEFIGVLGEIKNAAGSTEIAYKKMIEADITNQIRLLKNNFEAAAISISGQFAPAILTAVKYLNEFLKGGAELNGKIQTTNEYISILSTSFITATGAMLALSLILPKITLLLEGLWQSVNNGTKAMSALSKSMIVITVALASWEIGTKIKDFRIFGTTIHEYVESAILVVRQLITEFEILGITVMKNAYKIATGGLGDTSAFDEQTAALRKEAEMYKILSVEAAYAGEKRKNAAATGADTANKESMAVADLKKNFDDVKTAISLYSDQQKKMVESIEAGHNATMKSIEARKAEIEQMSAGTTKAKAQQEIEAAARQESKRYYAEMAKAAMDYYNHVDQELKSYMNTLNTQKNAEGSVSVEVKRQQQEILKAKIESATEAKAILSKALDDAISKEKQYAAEVKRLNDEIYQSKKTFADKLRDIDRAGMTDKAQIADKERQAEEKEAEAKALLAKGDEESRKRALELLKEAQALYLEDASKFAAATKQKAEALQELQHQQMRDNERKLKEWEIFRIAYEAGAGNEGKDKEAAKKIQEQINALLEEERKKQEENRKSAGDGIKSIEDGIKTINILMVEFAANFDKAVLADRKIKILLDETAYNDLKTKYDEIKDKTVKITMEQTTVEKKATGGLVGAWNNIAAFARGGQLPGWGGGDSVRALLEPGEFVIRKEAVSKFGAGFFNMLNSLNMPDLSSLKITAPSLPSTARQAFATGGMVTGGTADSGGGMMTLNLNIGGTTIKTYTDPKNADVLKVLNKQLDRSRKTGYQG